MMKNIINTSIIAIYDLFYGKPIDFYSPYTLDETYQYLQDAAELDKQKSKVWRVISYVLTGSGRDFKLIKLESVSFDSYRFIVKNDVGRNMSVKTYGEVTETDSGVKVVGIIKFNLIARLFLILCLISWIVITVMSIMSIPSTVSHLAPFSILGICLLMISYIYDQNKMYNAIHSTLGKSKSKNSEG